MLLREELTSRRYPLNSRLRLFDATISPTMLYGCVSWTTTKDLPTQLLRTQRRMLRLIINTPRRRTTNSNDNNVPETEAWPDYIRRTTAIASRMISNLRIETWDTTYWRRKWRWASRIASQPKDRWSRLACTWKPDLDNRRRAYRQVDRPRKRWDDEIQQFLQSAQPQPTHWLDAATDSELWKLLETKFLEHLQDKGVVAIPTRTSG